METPLLSCGGEQMPQIAIVPFEGDIRLVNVPIAEINENLDGFPDAYECISSHINEGESVKIYIAINRNQPLDNASDYILISCTSGYGLSYRAFTNRQNGWSIATNLVAPWTVCKSVASGKYCVVGWDKTHKCYIASDIDDDISYPAEICDILPPGGISIRCPDAVMQGLWIGIACDSLYESYIDFTCTLSGHTSPTTKLIQSTEKTVQLLCGSDESASSLHIVCESELGVTASKDITVLPLSGGIPDGAPGGGGGDATTSTVTNIDLYANPDTVAPGGRSTIEVSVNGTGYYSQAITAKLEGNTSLDTILIAGVYSGNVWVGQDETAEYVTVTVISEQDPSISASVRIYIDQDGTAPDPGSHEEQLRRAFLQGYAAARALFGGGGK